MRKLFSLLMVALFSASMWAADPVTVKSTFTKATVPAESKVTDLEGKVTWNIATEVGDNSDGDPTYGVGKSNGVECLKFGNKGTQYFKKAELSTDYFKDYNVTSVKLNVVNNAKKTGTFTAKQGSVTIGSEEKEIDNKTWTVLTANSTKGEGGTLTVTYELPQAFYISYIEVTYEEAAGGGETPDPDPESTIKTVYCKCEQGWWTADKAAVGIFAWTGEGESTVKNAEWPGVRMEAVAGEAGLWKYELDTAKYANVIFTRVNDEGAIADWGAKTADLTVPVDKNLYTITSSTAVWGDPGVDGSWSVYVPAKPAEDITFYLINNQEWAAPTAHVFVGETAEAAWPGKAMTKTEDKVNGFDVYSYTFKDNYTKIIFNDGKAENTIQTVDLEWAKEKPYFVPGAKNGEGKLEGTWYATKEEIPAPVVPQDITFYLINNQEWAAPTAHVFVGETAEAAWPGKAMTKTEDKVNGFDVYSYTFLDSYTKIIFNDGKAENTIQTVDLEWAKEKPYFVPGAKNGEGKLEGTWYATKEDIPAPPTPKYHIAGAWTSWKLVELAVAADEKTATYEVELAKGNQEFKIVRTYGTDTTWLTKQDDNTFVLHREFKGVAGVTSTANNNLGVNADENGVYLFTWTFANDSIGIEFPKQYALNEIWGVDAETKVAAGTKYVDIYALTIEAAYATTLKTNARTFGGVAFSHAIQMRNAEYPSAAVPQGTEQSGSTSLVVTAKENVEIELYYNRQTTSSETGAATQNDGKDLKVFDQAAPTKELEGTFKVLWMQEDKKYVNAIKTISLQKGHVYTISAKGTTIQLSGIRCISEAEAPTVKYYIVGNAEAFGEWSKFVPVYEDTYEIKDMPAGDYMFRLCMEDGVWTTDYGYAQLTVKPDGVSTNDDNNICFKFKEASDLKITYKPADGENPAVFTVAGNFYYKPVVTKEIKLVPNQWAEANAKIAAWVWDKEGEMTNYFTDFFAPIAEENDTLVAKINVEADSIIFVRFNASAAEPKWEGGEGYQWNQTPNDSIQWEKGIFTILPSEGYESKGTWDVYVPETPAKFYITGDSALVVDAGLTVDKKWEPNAIKSEAVSYKLNLKAGVDYMLKITLNGTWEGENNVKGYDEMTTPKNGLYRGEGENANNICFKLNADGEVSVHYDGEFFFLNGDFYVVPEPEKKYYLKNNWNGAEEWTWKEMTKKDAYYQLENVVFGGKGVNINTAESEEGQTWIAATDIAAMDMSTYEMTTLGALDTVVFVFDPEAVDSYTGENGLSAYIIGKYVEPAVPENVTIYFVNDENWEQVYTYVWYGASSSKAEWPGEPATKTELKARGYDVYSYTFPETYTKIIFNNNGSKQSTDLVWDIAKPYIYKNNCYASIDDIPEVIVEPKFRIAGNEALVIAAGLTADYAWNPGAIKAYEDTYTFENLPVGDYKLKLSVDGTWSTAMGYSDLSEKVDGLDADAAEYICFTLAEAGNVKVTYKAAEGENPAVFKVEGKFLVKVHTYTVVGNSTVIAAGWDETSTATEMILKDGVYTLIVEGVELLPATNYDYKIVYDHAWDVAYPQSGNASFSVEKSGIYDVLFTFDPETKAYAAIPELKKEIIVVPTVEIAGTFNEWQGAKLNVSEDKSTASIKLNLAKANYLFKIIIAGNWYGTGQSVTRTNTKLVVPETVEVEMSLIADATGEYTFTWTYATNEIAVTYPANADPDRLSEGFYLIGLNGWDVENIQPADKFIVNPNETSEYQLANVKLKAGDEFKAVYVFNDEIVGWYPNEDIKYVVTAEQAGTATIYFRSEYYTPWNGHFYVKVDESGTGMDNTAVDGKAVKMIKNGMFVIEKDGKTYNVMGVTIR